MISELLAETPGLAAGFTLNILISALSMTFGTALGAALGMLRHGGGIAGHGAGLLTNLCRNVPSFVLMFYLAFLLPVEFEFDGELYLFPVWVKATLALTFPVIGFASDQFLGFRRQVRAGETGADLVFLAAWVQYALIILMASATASVIGVDEILARANRIAGRASDPAALMLTYGYVALWFLAAGLVMTGIASRLARRSTRSRNVLVRHTRRRKRKRYTSRKTNGERSAPIGPVSE